MNCGQKVCCLALLIALQANAMPSNPQMANGDAKFEIESAEVLRIVTSDSTSIEWAEFSLKESETTIFVQPSNTSLVLNRVIGPSSSEILGTIQSNGKVLLMNPNGILIGRNAQINTASFIASTLDIHERAFEETGAFHFVSNSSAAVQNFGSIHSTDGAALLVGPRVENYGEIFANNGPSGLLAINGGEFVSDLKFHLAQSSNETYCIQAGSVHSTQNGGFGGTSLFIGNEIHFHSPSIVNVSGENGGGTVWVGALEKKFITPSNQTVQIDSGALIRADALIEGNGGSVLIFSSNKNNYYGFTSAKGGLNSGHGGKIEISAPFLAFEGTIDLTDSHGTAGYLILDPLDVTVAGANVNVTGVTPFTPTGLGATLNAATITGALAAGNVIITTVGTPPGGNGDVFINSPLVWSSNFSLTVDSARDINVANTGDIRCEGLGNGSVTLQALRNINVLADVRNANSANGIGVSGNVTLTSATGNITVGSAAQARNVSVCARKGTTTVTANTGNISILGGSAANAFSTIGESNQAPIGIVGTLPVASGPINVSCLGDLIMTAGTVSRAAVYIGKGGSYINAGAGGIQRDVNSTNINVIVGGNMTMTAGPGPAGSGNPECYIGNGGFQSASPPFRRRNGNIDVSVHGNLYMHSLGSFCWIGLGSTAQVNGGNGTILLRVGGNMTCDGTVGAGSSVGIFTYGDIPLNHNWNATAYIGGNLTLDGRIAQTVFRTFNYLQDPAIPPGYRVHVGGEINIIANTRTSNFQNGSTGVGIAPNFLWEIWAGGRIRAYNGPDSLNRGGTIFLSLGGQYDTVDLRSSSDIIQGGGEPNAVNFISNLGPLSIQADYPFAAGELWTAQTAIVNGINVFTGTPLGTDSPAIASDGIGAVAFDMNDYSISLVTFPPSPNGVSPPLFPTPSAAPALAATYNFPSVFISSTDVFSNLTPADFLNIGTAPGSVRFQSSSTDITITGHRNIAIANASITSARDALIIAQNDMTLTNATVAANRNVDLVVDNNDPVAPLIGPGAFNMNASSSIRALAGYIRVYTALQGQNNINPAAQFVSAGSPFLFTPGTIFQNTNQEQWCTYYPNGSLGTPFRIFYKNCLQIVLEQAQEVISEILFTFNGDPNFPYYGLDEYLGWPSRFIIFYNLYEGTDSQFVGDRTLNMYQNHLPEKYFIGKRNRLLNNPKAIRGRLTNLYFNNRS